MAQTRRVCGFVALIALFAAPYASAQAPSPSTSKFFVFVNVGGQLQSRTLDTSSSQSLYDETATLRASLPIGKGVVPDFGGGYRVWGNVFVGLTVSFFNDTGDASYTASIPDPLLFDKPKTVTGTQTGLKHSEVAYLPELIYARPVTDKMDVVGKIGPAIINLSQDSISSFTVPAGTQDLIINTASQSATGTGINVSIGVNYNLTDRYAVGGYFRYAGASVQLDGVADKQDVGGSQIGAGLRVNF
jgi:opacity protein-like surface antigen